MADWLGSPPLPSTKSQRAPLGQSLPEGGKQKAIIPFPKYRHGNSTVNYGHKKSFDPD